MSSVKRAVLDLVKALPDNCPLEDVQYQLYVREKVERRAPLQVAGKIVWTDSALEDLEAAVEFIAEDVF